MKRSTKYVALDVHQATTVASVREEGGRVIARTVLPTEAASIVAYVRGMRGAIHVTFEEGPQARWLHDLLVRVVDRGLVCDRRGRSPQGNKSDCRDADELSELLRRGALRAVCHGSPERAALKELARTYQNRVEDGTRVMLRLKALFRARGIKTPGRRVYDVAAHAEWLAQLSERGVWFRATALYAELEVLQALRPQAKTAMLTEAKRDPAWGVLRTIPFLGPVRVALLVATLQTPWRFRTKRHLWAYAGLAVVTRASAEYALDAGRPIRRRRAPMTRGLNRNYNRVLKDVLKGAATAAATRAGPLQDLYHGMLMRGMREELARVTLTRKLAALTLHLWKTGEHYDPTKLTMPAVPARVRETVSTSAFTRRPVRRGPRRTIGPPAEPEKASGRLRRVSDRTMVRSARPKRLHGSNRSWSHREENDAEDRTADDSAISRTPISLARSRIGADCHGQTGQTLSRHEVRT